MPSIPLPTYCDYSANVLGLPWWWFYYQRVFIWWYDYDAFYSVSIIRWHTYYTYTFCTFNLNYLPSDHLLLCYCWPVAIRYTVHCCLIPFVILSDGNYWWCSDGGDKLWFDDPRFPVLLFPFDDITDGTWPMMPPSDAVYTTFCTVYWLPVIISMMPVTWCLTYDCYNYDAWGDDDLMPALILTEYFFYWYLYSDKPDSLFYVFYLFISMMYYTLIFMMILYIIVWWEWYAVLPITKYILLFWLLFDIDTTIFITWRTCWPLHYDIRYFIFYHCYLIVIDDFIHTLKCGSSMTHSHYFVDTLHCPTDTTFII